MEEIKVTLTNGQVFVVPADLYGQFLSRNGISIFDIDGFHRSSSGGCHLSNFSSYMLALVKGEPVVPRARTCDRPSICARSTWAFMQLVK